MAQLPVFAKYATALRIKGITELNLLAQATANGL
jgi:hypothetical protein